MNDFTKWATGFSGCDGGDIGSPESPSIWVCGLEWGGGHHTLEKLTQLIKEDVSEPPQGYDDWAHNLKFRFNWNVAKLLGRIHGRQVSDYKSFVETTRPFTQGAEGFFKMNLFPIGFRSIANTKNLPGTDLEVLCGCSSKREYFDWCREHRLPVLRSWARMYRPKLIVGLGKTYEHDFLRAFADQGSTFNVEEIEGRELRWLVNNEGTLVVVTPFVSGRWGLVSNVAMDAFGARIGELLRLHTCSQARVE